MRTDSPITITAGEDLPQYRRVRHNGTSWVLADAGETHEAVTCQTILSGKTGAAWTGNDAGEVPIECSAAISAGAEAFAADDGKCTSAGPGLSLGITTTLTTASGDTATVLQGQHPTPLGLVYASTAASAALTASSTPTDFDKTHTFAANTLKVGDVIKIKGFVRATATNSTDTLAVDVKLGSVTILAMAAVDVANDDIAQFEMEVTVRATGDGATGVIIAHGQSAVIGAAGTATVRPRYLAATNLDTTAAAIVKVTGTWSTTSGSNSCRLDSLTVEHHRRAA